MYGCGSVVEERKPSTVSLARTATADGEVAQHSCDGEVPTPGGEGSP